MPPTADPADLDGDGAVGAADLAILLGQWGGPVRSGFGLHLVRPIALTPAAVPPLDAIRTVVAREWENDRRNRSATENYQRMRARYEVVTEPAAPTKP
jgi:hypothetical protein